MTQLKKRLTIPSIQPLWVSMWSSIAWNTQRVRQTLIRAVAYIKVVYTCCSFLWRHWNPVLTNTLSMIVLIHAIIFWSCTEVVQYWAWKILTKGIYYMKSMWLMWLKLVVQIFKLKTTDTQHHYYKAISNDGKVPYR